MKRPDRYRWLAEHLLGIPADPKLYQLGDDPVERRVRQDGVGMRAPFVDDRQVGGLTELELFDAYAGAAKLSTTFDGLPTGPSVTDRDVDP